tara:strand:- start:1948 stop:2346 length:399 start_codon:yes stop_codon:yes gene_type:complete
MSTPVIKHTSQELSAYPSMWDQTTSTFDNCILLNAILRNRNLYDDDEVRYLRQLQQVDLISVDEYYTRSERIINRMRQVGGDNDGVWDEIDRTYVSPIIEKLKVRNFKNLFSDIRNVLEQLELKYEVVYNGN